MSGVVVDITSVQHLDQLLKEQSHVVAHFWAAWCEPCKQMDLVMSLLAKDHPGFTFVRVEAEALDDLSLRYDVNMVPYFIIFKGGKQLDHVGGADAAALTSKVQQLSKSIAAPQPTAAAAPAASTAAAAPQPSSKEDVMSRIKRVLASQPVMLFMKGSPDAPRCGFSRKVAEALAEDGITYGHFDILQDEELRQALKAYSNWPTYPQLYVNGELLGGCDIIMEMKSAGELGSTIKAQLPQQQAKPVNERIKHLLDSHPIMLFLKGSPEAPKCGFSRRVAEGLEGQGLKYGHYDILQDEELREALKKYSNWPTYPQLYVRGELLGGCDIVTEMVKNGELKSTVEEMLNRMDVAA